MPTGASGEDQQAGQLVPLSFDVVDPAGAEAMPARKELILRGRASLVDLGHDPDDWVDEETQEDLRAATPQKTIETLYWGWGRFITYCGRTSRRHDPPTAATMRQYIKDHWHMTKRDGTKPGRRGQPYAPATVELAVYTVAMICNRMDGWSNPVRNPIVHDQLDAYHFKFEQAGYTTSEPAAMTPEHSVALARSGDLGTINGLRNAAMFRLQFDTGCRATEMCKLRMQDIQWVSEDKLMVTFIAAHTKGRKKRTVAVQAVRDVDWDVDPVRLLGLLYDANRSAGYTAPNDPLFHDVVPGNRRKDWDETGTYGGSLRPGQVSYAGYEMAFNRAVTKSGIDRDPRTGERTLHYTTHSNRAGFLTSYGETGRPLERAAARTGHSPSSPVLSRYFRSRLRWDDDNEGVIIRRKTAADAEAK